MAVLPKETNGKHLSVHHFPTAYQTLIFRLWDKVSKEKLAEVLQTTVDNVKQAAFDMGLGKQKDTKEWLTKGYISILKEVWNLLPYEQIYTLLDWDEDRLSFVLKEDDYLGIKLGEKCDCPLVLFRELSVAEKRRTNKIKEIVISQIKPLESDAAEPFNFFDKKYKPIVSKCIHEVVVNSDWGIEYPDNCGLEDFVSDFKVYALKYGVNFSGKSNQKIKISVDIDSNDEEYHEIKIEKEQIIINAASAMGVLRALYYIEELAESAGTFSFEIKNYKRTARIKTRFIYSFCGLYGDVLDRDSKISFPDELLLEYARRGINGVWIQGVLYKMAPYPFDEELSKGWENRLENLKMLTIRAARYGIRIYIYINEPRNMSDSFFEKYPHLKGASLVDGLSCLCSSNEETHKYLKEAIQTICREVPLLGGFFDITQTENRVLCCSDGRNLPEHKKCPVCGNKSYSAVISDIVKTMANAVKEINPQIKFFYYAWSLSHTIGDDEAQRLMKLLPDNVIVLQVSETEMGFERGGIQDEILDYSLSIVGPGDCAKKLWKSAKENGLKIAAKVQLNNSWECSTAPFVPVYNNVVEHMNNLINEGVEHIMLSWTLGGYISDNIKIASSYFFKDVELDVDAYNDILNKTYGDYSDCVKEAVNYFCRGFSEYPFNWNHIYTGPSNSGVANPLYPEPSAMTATMTCYPYDDIWTWRGISAKNPNDKEHPLYTEEVLENQYARICKEWEKGLEYIEDMPLCEFKDMAIYAYTLFKSAHNQIRYYIERNGKKDINVMNEIVKSEKELALKVYEIMCRNSAVGYEAANHYYVTRSMIAEKIIQCEYLLNG